MKKISFAISLTLLIHLFVTGQTNLETQLFELEDISFKKIEAPEGFEAAYELSIKQPLDHDHPEKGYFHQKAFLSHRGFNNPTVQITEGYNRDRNRVYELSNLLDANQIDIEHRFYGESIPEKMDYSYLTLEQATADHHRINQLFRKLYNGKWVSTGISKGGQTTIFYRYFFPDDVDASVPYVAPLNLEFEEKRIYHFLDTIGSDQCREAIKNVQVRLLKNRDKVMPLLKWYSKGAELEYSYLTLDEAFEYAILEYPFSFWQWGHKCEDIPGKQSSLDETLEHFLAVSGIDFFSDFSMLYFGSHYYQAASQMGYYGYETEDFKGLLKALPMQPHPHAAFTPEKMQVTYDGALPKKVSEWLKTNGNKFIYIYGANDTWTATAVPPSDKVDAHWFFMKGKDHGQARIKNMNKSEEAQLIEALESWLSIKINNSLTK